MIKRTVVLGTETAMRKELMHGLTTAAHRIATAETLPSVRPRAAGTAGPAPSVAAVATVAPAPQPENHSLKDVSRTAARGAERDLIARMLQQTRWNRKETADILGISYKALLYKIKENGLDKAL
jgi:two-component system response regulator AtoC